MIRPVCHLEFFQMQYLPDRCKYQRPVVLHLPQAMHPCTGLFPT